MIKIDSPHVDLYQHSDKVTAIVQFKILGFSLENDKTKKIDEEKRKAYQKAIEEALSKWELE